MSLALLTTAVLLFAPPPATPVLDCTYGASTPIPQTSTWSEQFRCYQNGGRRVSVAGTQFAEGAVSGGFCIKGVANDRLQVAKCNSFGQDVAVTIPFTNIAYLTDNPDQEYVVIYLNGKIGG